MNDEKKNNAEEESADVLAQFFGAIEEDPEAARKVFFDTLDAFAEGKKSTAAPTASADGLHLTSDGRGSRELVYRECEGEGMAVTECETDVKRVRIAREINGAPVTRIKAGAFENCDVRVVEIPDTVKRIEADAFLGCENLCEIIVSEDNPYFLTIDGNVYTKNGKTLVQYAIGKEEDSFSIPSGYNYIGDSAFRGCKNLTRVLFHSEVKTVGDFAFADCTALRSVSLPSSVTEIRPSAFSGCSALCALELSEGLEWIRDSAFYNCSALTEITVPSSVVGIGEEAFADCSSLSSVKGLGGVKVIDEGSFFGCERLAEIELPITLERIHAEAFGSCVALSLIRYNGTKDDWKYVKVEGSENEKSLLLGKMKGGFKKTGLFAKLFK